MLHRPSSSFPLRAHISLSRHLVLEAQPTPPPPPLCLLQFLYFFSLLLIYCLYCAFTWIIVGWALMMLSLGLVTFGFPCVDVQEHDLNTAFIIYITMLILELGIWIPMCTYISPPEGRLKKTKPVLRASFVIFNLVSNILEQIISSISNSNYGRLFIFINLFCGVVSFLIISALFWRTIDVEGRYCLKWEHLPLGCNAVLAATLVNISVFQLIVKKTFLHFPLIAILRDVVNLIDFIIKITHKKEIA